MAILRIDLKLEAAEEGKQQLRSWPKQNFRPDFIVAASGKARLEMAGKLIAVAPHAYGSLVWVEPAELEKNKELNPWFPDYIAGFALSLAEAAATLKQGQKKQARARFVDEPLEIMLEHPEENPKLLRVSFRQNNRAVATCENPASLVYAEVGRALQDFMVQLLNLNPELSEFADIERLRHWISQIVG